MEAARKAAALEVQWAAQEWKNPAAPVTLAPVAMAEAVTTTLGRAMVVVAAVEMKEVVQMVVAKAQARLDMVAVEVRAPAAMVTGVAVEVVKVVMVAGKVAVVEVKAVVRAVAGMETAVAEMAQKGAVKEEEEEDSG